MLSEKYLDHFSHPRGVGEIDPADFSAEVQHEGGGCFDRIRLTLGVDNGLVSEVRFRARACSGTIAACSALVEFAAGKTLVEAKSITADDLNAFLGGVPEKKRHSIELAAEAIRVALS